MKTHFIVDIIDRDGKKYENIKLRNEGLGFYEFSESLIQSPGILLLEDGILNHKDIKEVLHKGDSDGNTPQTGITMVDPVDKPKRSAKTTKKRSANKDVNARSRVRKHAEVVSDFSANDFDSLFDDVKTVDI